MTTSLNNLDPELVKNGDTRNVVDRYRCWTNEAIKADMQARATSLEIAIENLTHDFNMGTVVRNANAFNVRRVHIIGRKQWNKRGAMVTNRYLEVIHHPTVGDFMDFVAENLADYHLIAIDNQAGAQDLAKFDLSEKSLLIFGSESDGISEELRAQAEAMVQIEQLGSTRSVNVGVASGIVMYEWTRRFVFSKK